MRIRVLFMGAVLLAAASPTWARQRLRAEFQVNTYTTGVQSCTAVAVQPDGPFMIAWASEDQDGSGMGVYGQRFDARGGRLGSEFQINTYTTGHQSWFAYENPVAAATDDGYVIVWPSDGQDGDSWGVYGQRFGAGGSRLGAEFRVNELTASDQRGLGIASCPGGGFVVVWDDYGSDGSGWGVFGRRFGPTGQPLGGQFGLSTLTTAEEVAPRVACAADGHLLAVWHRSPRGQNGYEVRAQLFDGSGQRQGAELDVSGHTPFGSVNARVRAVPDGYVVAWERYDDDSVVARRLDASGAPLGAEIKVATMAVLGFANVDVAAAGDGGFAVIWSDGFDTYARRFDPLGQPVGSRLAVDTPPDTTPRLAWRSFPNVAMDAAGDFVVAYESYALLAGDDADRKAVFARRLSALAPAGLEVDAPGNGILERGEEVEVKPRWTNVGPVEQQFASLLDAPLGPVPGQQEVTDGSATYAAVPGGATGTCSDCYHVAASASIPAEITHYDFSAIERLDSPTQHVEKEWVLHVGGSFEDVERTSAYYRSIETLLHNSVTPGCAHTLFCPAATLHRDEMASWLLLAREGGQYQPYLCFPGRPRFTDVPSSNPYCAFVEEFARRGITAGCGSGRYCPQADVTRAEMAVFLLRTLDPALSPPACTTPVFTDVPASSAYCRWIEELARRGVVTGCGGGAYCPDQSVTREQMAAFVAATFGLTLYGP